MPANGLALQRPSALCVLTASFKLCAARVRKCAVLPDPGFSRKQHRTALDRALSSSMDFCGLDAGAVA